ncbi:MAG: hypothetical protein BJ554DRAFT_7508 [Olpidium bornovanus]|uniref:Uncharacterized protein n=1 Tax=Olpidium bornovanus TaxID=278681 RepID=A0A8H7ZWG1_9FUNG|nr:MAG: hypothetical protein BJ554DRAFT_7508 [Olpidium bornovanus]
MDARRRAKRPQEEGHEPVAPGAPKPKAAAADLSTKKAKRTRAQRLLAAAPYIAVAAGTAYFADLRSVLLDKEARLHWAFLAISALCAACVVLVFVYLSVFIPLTTGRAIGTFRSRHAVLSPAKPSLLPS